MADGMTAEQVICEPGVYDIPMDWYHSQCCDGPSVSSGGLRKIENESPAHFWCQARGLNPNAIESGPNAAFSFGKAVHALLFDDQDEISRLVVSPFESFRTNAAKEWRDEQYANGRTLITEDDMAHIHGIHKALSKEAGCAELLTAGEPEQSMIWKDKETGVWLKSRPDRLPSDLVFADLKTTKCAKPSLLNTEIVNRGYHMQLALACMGLKELRGEDATDCWLVFVEKTPPYAVGMVRIADDLIDYGQRQCRRAIRKFADCLESGDWPAYTEGPYTAHGPKWFSDKCEREIEELTL